MLTVMAEVEKAGWPFISMTCMVIVLLEADETYNASCITLLNYT